MSATTNLSGFDIELPTNVDAEKTILGAIMLDNAAHSEAAERLEAGDFSLDSHQRIYTRMCELANAQRPIDIVTLSHELAQHKEIEAVGGVAYLASLTEGLPRRPVIEEYIRIVKDKCQLRRLMTICSSTITRAADQSETAQEIAGWMLSAVEKVGSKISPAVRARVVRLADVTAKPVRWLWAPYVPLGMVSMISGDPGAGKSYVAMAIAAEVTTGIARDGRRRNPAGVLYLTLENPIAEVLRPRLDSLGGDASRFFVVTGTVYEDKQRTDESGIITLEDLELLDETIEANDVRLVVIDPLTSFFGGGKNLNHSNDTRPVFDRLAKMAEKHDLAALVIRHNNKQQGGRAIYRGAGSVDMTGAVRCEMLAAVSPDNPDQRALAHIKTNIGPQGRTQGYVIEADGQDGVRFAWTGELAVTAEELNAAPEAPETRTKQDEAREWLLEILRGGSLPQKELEKMADGAGLKWRTIRRAKDDCPAIKSRKAAMGGHWIWYLAEGTESA
jgi:hypothetical protein